MASLLATLHRALLDRRRSVLIWGGSLGALGAFMAAIYPSIQTSIESVVRNYPSSLKAAFGVEAMNTVEGYVHAEMFSLIVPLAIGFLAVRTVASMTAGAEENGFLDTTLSLPISRGVLMIAAVVATGIVVAAVMVLTGVMTFIAGRVAGTHISAGLVTAGVMGVWPLAMLAAGIAALLSGLLHTSRSVVGASLGILVAMYAFDLAGQLAHALEPIRWASAFRYYGAPMRDGIDPLYFLALTGVGIGLTAAGAALFERRDVLP